MAKKVRDVMTRDPLQLEHTSSVTEAAQAMRDSNVGAILIRKQDGGCSIVTDRDLVVRVLADGGDALASRTVGEASSDSVITVGPDDDVEKVLKIMRERSVRRVPVVEQGKAIGIVALGDLAADRDPRSVLGEISNAPPNR